MSRFAAHKTYNAQKLLRILKADEDWDEEAIDVSEPSMHDVDEDLDIEQEDGREEKISENKVLSLPDREQITNRDGTIWISKFPPQYGRANKRNIIKTRPGTKQFILAHVDNAKDVFQEFLGHKNVDHILKFTIAEARRQEDSEFSLSKKTCLFWPVPFSWIFERKG